MTVRYFALTEFELGETVADPGGLVRRVDNGRTVHYEVLYSNGTWHEATFDWLWVTMHPTHGDRTVVSQEAAEALMDNWPPSNLRAGYRAG